MIGVVSKIFNLRPTVSRQGQSIVATTAPASVCLSLGLGYRRVVIDDQQKAVRIFARYGWLFQQVRHIPFDVVTAVENEYVELNNRYNPLAGITAYQSQDVYTVKLHLVNGEEVPLFRFYGAGAFQNNSYAPDWMFWQDALVADLTRVDQATASQQFAGTVASVIGVRAYDTV